MKINTMKAQTQEIFVEGDDVDVTVTEWSSLCGVNVILTNHDLSVRMAASLRWEDVDALMLALTAARAE